MNKYVFIGIITVLLIAAIISLIVLKPKVFKNPKELELPYEMNAGIPFKRVYEIEDETVVEFVKNYIAKDENTNGKVGASIYTTYVFKGLKEGITTITFKVVSITGEYEDSEIVVHKVQVDNNLNISIIDD